MLDVEYYRLYNGTDPWFDAVSLPWFLWFSQKFAVFFLTIFCHDFLLSLAMLYNLRSGSWSAWAIELMQYISQPFQYTTSTHSSYTLPRLLTPGLQSVSYYPFPIRLRIGGWVDIRTDRTQHSDGRLLTNLLTYHKWWNQHWTTTFSYESDTPPLDRSTDHKWVLHLGLKQKWS